MQITVTIDLEGDAYDANAVAQSINVEASRLAEAFSFCADDRSAPIQRRIANLRKISAALLDATA